MKTAKILMVLLLLTAFAGCTAGDDVFESAADHGQKITRVVFVPVIKPMEPVSRAMNENSIYGYDSWLYHNSGKLISSISSIFYNNELGSLDAIAGRKYRVAGYVNNAYIITKYSGNPDEFGDVWCDYESIRKAPRMPMSFYEKDISIPYNFGYPFTYPCKLKRVLAKVVVNATVAAGAGDITLHSLDICNVPDKVKLFDVEPTQPEELVYTKLAVSDAVITGNTITATVYLPENIRGVNPAITTPEEKYADNAPANATYIRIGALVSGLPVNYNIYIGENKTGDFNLRRNTFHTYNITITGADPADRRIEFIFNDGDAD